MSVFSWGWGSDGQLGLGVEDEEIDKPKLIAPLLENGHVKTIACGHKHTACITVHGDLITWGRGTSGQLGHGDKRERTSPVRVEGLGAEDVVAVAAGQYHTVAATEDEGAASCR